MDQSNQSKPSKPKTSVTQTIGLRVKRETKKRIQAELAKTNKKDFGKKVRCDELIGIALSLLTDRHTRQLQEGSLSNSDRIERQYQEYIKKHGPISRDVFLGKLLAGGIAVSLERHEPKENLESLGGV